MVRLVQDETERSKWGWAQVALTYQWGVSADGPQQQRTDHCLFHCWQLTIGNLLLLQHHQQPKRSEVVALRWSVQILEAAWNHHLVGIKEGCYYLCILRFGGSFFRNTIKKSRYFFKKKREKSGSKPVKQGGGDKWVSPAGWQAAPFLDWTLISINANTC